MAIPAKNPIITALVRAAEKEKFEETLLSPGTRRLRDLSRDITRPLEVRQWSARQRGESELRISHALDLHPDDLGALAATCGQI